MAERPGTLYPSALRCEQARNPLGIDGPRPRLSWQVRGAARGDRQTAYRVLAASSRALLREGRADRWDSGRVAAADTLLLPYDGRAPRPGERVWWTVRVWDAEGRPSAFAPAAWFEMGLMGAGWHARWIGGPPPDAGANPYAERPAPLLRSEFRVDGKVRRARAYVAGLGLYELRLNGARVGDAMLDPPWTSYARRVFYASHDVGALLRPGANAVGVIVGRGWYDPLPLRMWGSLDSRKHLRVGEPCAVVQIEVEYADGRTRRVVSDGTWRVAVGPIRRDSLYLGESYDARLERPGWDTGGFDDTGWRAARVLAPEIGPLEARPIPPIRVTERLRPVAVTEPSPGVYVFDMGRNLGGLATLRVSGPAGARVTMRFGELLHPDGTLNVLTSCCGQIKPGRASGGPGAPETACQTDTYVLRGAGQEVYTPRFTFHGFRYVEVTGYPGRPPRDAVEALAMRTDVAVAGDFRCSNARLNRIQRMAVNTFASNLFGVQSDCPHRERLGYGGDIVATARAVMANMDMGAFYAKSARDLADAARPSGAMTETAPFVGIADGGYGYGSGPVGWGTAFPLLQWLLWQRGGDRRLLEECWPATLRWVAFLESVASDDALDHGIGDHEGLAPKDVPLTSTAFYHENARLAARIARALGHRADAARLEALAARIADGFGARFVDLVTGRCGAGTQACQAFTLALGLAPTGAEQTVLRRLAADIEGRDGGRLTTGIFGTQYLLRALSDGGRADLALRIVDGDAFPGWGYMLTHGATTMWEHWAREEDVFSHNHPMFGSVSEWMFECVAGIRPAEDAVGFDRIVIRPRGVPWLTSLRAHHDTPRGRIAIAWRRARGTLALDLQVPANTTTMLWLPTADPGSVREGGRAAAGAEGVRFLRAEPGWAVYALGSGSYHFQAAPPAAP
ncbi:MAG: family 78 glycoside hydrolase catalytic domain [Chthonomonadales bacterium]|nr:family 78 glycoside hydrolase catalytic domain [Chthonomonadales bacterium]